MTKILYIEDEPNLGKIVQETLQKQGFEVRLINDGARVMQTFTTFLPDVCVVDIMLPNIDGYSLCRMIRHQYPGVAVIFLTARAETSDLVKGFEAGGTDYIKKPFSMEELIVRINNQMWLIRNEKKTVSQTELKLGRYRYCPSRFELMAPDRCIKLSCREQEILSMLTGHLNQVTDRKKILQAVWGDDSYFNSRTLDVYIRKIRNYFSSDPNIELVTLKGKGYLFLLKNSPERSCQS